MALVDNTTGPHKTLRMSQLRITKPALLASKPIQFNIVGPAASWIDDVKHCHLSAPGKAGQLNWLFDIDTASNTMTTGGAKPAANPHAGYCYANQSYGDLLVAPTTVPISVTANGNGTSSFATTGMFEVSVPIFLDSTGTTFPIVLPIKGATITSATLGEGGNCIGRFRGKTGELDPNGSCLPQTSDPKDVNAFSYLNDATIAGYMTAEDTDKIVVVDLAETMCALLTGKTMMSPAGTKVCKRDAAGNLDFTGTTSGPDFSSKGDGINDAFEIAADFAAAAVRINGVCP